MIAGDDVLSRSAMSHAGGVTEFEQPPGALGDGEVDELAILELHGLAVRLLECIHHRLSPFDLLGRGREHLCCCGPSFRRSIESSKPFGSVSLNAPSVERPARTVAATFALSFNSRSSRCASLASNSGRLLSCVRSRNALG